MDSLSRSSQYDSANVAPPFYSLFYGLEGQSGYACTYRNKHEGNKEPTSGLGLLTCSLRVCGQWLLSVAQNCKSRINRRFLFPPLLTVAGYCVWVRVKLGSSNLDSYSHWIPSMGRHAADGLDEALGKRGRLPASAKSRWKRAWSYPSLPCQWSIHDPVYRSYTRTCMSQSSSVAAFRIEPWGFEAALYARCCMQISENLSYRHLGEQTSDQCTGTLRVASWMLPACWRTTRVGKEENFYASRREHGIG
jgi:hypothetical protein